MVIFRLLSLILIAAALMLLGKDAYEWWQGGEHSLLSVAVLIDDFCGAGTTEGFSSGWPPAAKMVLGWPSWAVLGVLGLILAVVFRRRA